VTRPGPCFAQAQLVYHACVSGLPQPESGPQAAQLVQGSIHYPFKQHSEQCICIRLIQLVIQHLVYVKVSRGDKIKGASQYQAIRQTNYNFPAN
jgi:hypothetical protein